MIKGVNLIKGISVKSDEQVESLLATKLSNNFTKEKKEAKLLNKWFEEVVGEEEENNHIIAHLNKNTLATKLDKFKKMCSDEKARAELVEKCKKPRDGLDDIDED